MAKRAKNVSMDAAFKSLLRDFDIPGKKDFDKLNAKIDRLEKMLKKSVSIQPLKGNKTPRKQGGKGPGRRRLSATSAVLASIKRSKKGADFASLQAKTGFDEKKLRNIIFRLHKLGKVNRVGRGLYLPA